MDLAPEFMAELLAEFADELRDQTEIISHGLLQIEERPQDISQALIAAMFRGAHNIKGAALSLGLAPLGELAHQLETVFDALRAGELPVGAALADPCLTAVDAMPEVLVALQAGESEQAQFLAARAGVGLHLLASTVDTGARSAAPSPSRPGRSDAAPLDPQVAGAPDPQVAGAPDPQVAGAPDPQVAGAPDPQVAQSHRERPSDRTAQEIIRVGLHRFERVQSLAESVYMTKIALSDQYDDYRSLREAAESLLAQWQRTLTGLPPDTPDSVRVLLQSLHDGAGRLRSDMGAFDQMLHGLSRQLSLVSDSLRDELHHVRLEPVGALLDQLRRPVRDAARSLGRSVELVLVGTEVETDRVVLDALRDPLIHLVRNAVDHGIEDPAERVSAGKPQRGTIRIEVSNNGGEVRVRLCDDGRGLDRGAVAAAALAKGLVSDADLATMTDADVYELIFRPGFTTRTEVSDISGRGVGLDAVRSALVALGGHVDVRSSPGAGSEFRLRFPLTVANEHAVIVSAGGERLALPITAVERVLLVSSEEVRSIAGTRAIEVSGRLVSLTPLAAALGLPEKRRDADSPLQVVVVAKGADPVAFEVDEIVGQREILVKPLGHPLKSVRNVSGGTLTGRGDVIIVVNPFDLVDTAIGSTPAGFGAAATVARTVADDAQPDSTEGSGQRILVAEDVYTTRMLEISILRTAGFTVDAAVDGADAWQKLQRGGYHLLVTDIDMPNMTGLELAGRIRAHDRLGNLPIIIVSARDSPADRHRGAEVGADAYLTKSAFHTGDLVDTARGLLL